MVIVIAITKFACKKGLLLLCKSEKAYRELLLLFLFSSFSGGRDGGITMLVFGCVITVLGKFNDSTQFDSFAHAGFDLTVSVRDVYTVFLPIAT